MGLDLQGKVVLLTGGTEGIGKAAALDLARRGATLTIVGRNQQKTERVLADLKSQSGNAALELLLGDLSSIQEAKAVAAAFKAKNSRLDLLVNNAGAVFNTHQKSADGLEMTFALNHLGYFVITMELLDLLKATPGARVVSTSSGAHMTGNIRLDSIAKRPGGSAGFGAYGDSKLCNILFTRELARRLGPGATANCFHPGFVATGFAQNNGGFMAAAVKVVGNVFARTPEKGAETLLWLATSPDAASLTGQYCHDKKVAKTHARGTDDAMAAKLWALSEELVRAAG